uniref:CCHC-type domain-containing protein n=1 Tax=Quercus lobata TaxID=97700 RepID=A0A7N2MSN6_QUELO
MQLDTVAALASALAAKNVKNFKKGRPQCTHCGAMGHVVDKCYKLHGYPLGYKFKSTRGQAAATLPPFANNVIAPEDDASGGLRALEDDWVG